MHYYKRNIGDYHKKAGRLSILQHGVYTLLLDAIYDREVFPDLEQAIDWVWASNDAEIDAIKFVLKKFFTLEDGVYIQQRVKDDIAAYKEKAVKNKQIAIDREAKRAMKSNEKVTSRDVNNTKRARNVDGVFDDSHESPPNHKPLTINQEPITTNQLRSKALSPKADDSVCEIFDYWKFVMQKTNSAKLTDKRKKLISARLKDGYPVEDFKTAILNCSNSSFHMGDNQNSTRFNDIELICRPDKFENFRDNVGQQPVVRQFSNATERTINNLRDLELN